MTSINYNIESVVVSLSPNGDDPFKTIKEGANWTESYK